MASLAEVEQIVHDLRRLRALGRELVGSGDAAKVEVEVLGAGERGVRARFVDLGGVLALSVIEGRRALHREGELASDDRDMPNQPGEELLLGFVGGQGHVVIDLTHTDVTEKLGSENVGRRKVLLLRSSGRGGPDREVTAVVLVEDASEDTGESRRRRVNS